MTKQYFFTSFLMLVVLVSEAQTQKGYIRTISRPNRAAMPVSEVTIQVSEGNKSVLSNDKGEFSFPCTAESYRIMRIQKTGFQLVDKGVIGRLNPYSAKVAQEIVMVSQTDLNADKKKIENKAYERAQANYQKRLDAIRKEMEEKRITEQQAAQAEATLGDNYQKFIEKIENMAEHYAMMDYEGINDLNRQILQYIENAELEKADSLINSKGDIEARIKDVKEQQQVAEAAENMTRKIRENYMSRLNDIAEDLFNKYTIYKSRFQNDSAVYYLEQRAKLDSTNVEWQIEAGAFVQYYIADFAKALSYYNVVIHQSILQYGEKSEWTAKGYNNTGTVYADKCDFDKALEFHTKALTIYETVIGEEHPDVASSYNNIGNVYVGQRNISKAMYYHTKALSIREKIFGTEHPNVADSYSNIGYLYALKKEYNKALEYHLKALDIRMKYYSTEHPDVALSYNGIGTVYVGRSDYAKALEYYTKALAINKDVFGIMHPNVASSYFEIGTLYLNKGNYAQALQYYDMALNIFKNVYGTEHPNVASSYCNIGMAYTNLGDYKTAMEYYNKALAIFEKELGPDHKITKHTIKIMNYVAKKGKIKIKGIGI